MKIAALTPYFGGRIAGHLACMRGLEKLGITIIEIDSIPYIDMARAVLVETALENKIDIMVFIDHDIIFKAEDVLKLAKHLEESEYDILAGAYSARVAHGKIIVVRPIAKEIEFYKPGLYDASMCALGFTAIKRRVFEKLKEDLPYLHCAAGRKVTPYFAHLVEEKYYGEDYSFCIRAKRAGFAIGIDAEPRLMHRGSYDYLLEDAGERIPTYGILTVKFNPED